MPSPRDKSPAAGVIPPRLLAVPCFFLSPESLGFNAGDFRHSICIHVNIQLQSITHRITLHVYIYIYIYTYCMSLDIWRPQPRYYKKMLDFFGSTGLGLMSTSSAPGRDGLGLVLRLVAALGTSRLGKDSPPGNSHIPPWGKGKSASNFKSKDMLVPRRVALW